MSVQNCFKRFELKYKLNHAQYHSLLMCMKNYMRLDEYKRHKVSNIYFDTDDYRVIRYSLEKPKYKEKLRIRIYGNPQESETAFVELKKKFEGVVYKRRIALPQKIALNYFDNDFEKLNCEPIQIHKEIHYFAKNYDQLKAKVYLAYEREAYFAVDDINFRMTFDFNIKMRNTDISFDEKEQDIQIVDSDTVLLEVKTMHGLPFWFIEFLNQNKLYKTAFSKYGTAYTKHILPSYLNKERSKMYA